MILGECTLICDSCARQMVELVHAPTDRLVRRVLVYVETFVYHSFLSRTENTNVDCL